MKTYLYKNEKVQIIKDLNIKDKKGTWVQIEFLEGSWNGCRVPSVKEDLTDLI